MPTIFSVARALCSITICLHFTGQVSAVPTPTVLLRGVEQSRSGCDSLSVKLTIRVNQLNFETTYDCIVESSFPKTRFEILPSSSFPGTVVIRDGDSFLGYTREKHADLEFYDFGRAVGVRGDLAFDARALGLSELMPCSIDVKKCLWLKDRAQLELVGKEVLNGFDTWRVKATKPSGTYSEYWIEEPGFRVHRRTIVSKLKKIQIDSSFDTSGVNSPYPSNVIARHEHTDHVSERVYTVAEFNTDVDIADDRFTAQSIGLPINTMANDYSISRITGYWNGEDWSEAPIHTGERLEAVNAPESKRRSHLIMINVCVVLVLAIIVIRRFFTRKSEGGVA